MPNFQYRTLASPDGFSPEFVTRLNEAGAEGWEAVALEERTGTVVLLKRAVPEVARATVPPLREAVTIQPIRDDLPHSRKKTLSR